MTWLTLPAAMLVVLAHQFWLVAVWSSLLLVVSILTVMKTIPNALRSKDWDPRLLAVVAGLILLVGIRDFSVTRFSSTSYEMIQWIRFAWMGFGLSMAWIIVERLRRSNEALHSLNASMHSQLEHNKEQLAAAFGNDLAHAKKRSALDERQRIMADLHDGLGSQLVGALRVAQATGPANSTIVHQLQDAVDQLKVTVDAMNETEGDIPALLGAVRYRLTPRLEAAGINLKWHVTHLPTMPQWGVRESYQLQMILFELFTNMVTHSHATMASLEATLVCEGAELLISIVVTDNGQGFGIQRPILDGGLGKGLTNMKHRAVGLGARLDMASRPGVTQTTLMLPVVARLHQAPFVAVSELG